MTEQPNITDTLNLAGASRADLTTWLAEAPHTWQDGGLVLHASDGDVRPGAGWMLVRWSDGQVTAASPHVADRAYGSDGLHGRLQRAEAAIERVRERCQPVRDREGPSGMINASQILSLLSSTWPDGNHEAPAHAGAPDEPSQPISSEAAEGLFVHESAAGLIDEIRGYSWDGSVTAAFGGLVAGVRRAAASAQDDFALADGSTPALRDQIGEALDQYGYREAWDGRALADVVLSVILPATRITATLARDSEADVSRVISLYERWVKAGPPPLGVSLSRWWDKRLVELHNAILPPTDQAKEQ